MGGGASKKKREVADKGHGPELFWAHSATHSIALPGPATEFEYTGLCMMGLAQLKPHGAGELRYTAPALEEVGAKEDAVSRSKGQFQRSPSLRSGSLKSAVSRDNQSKAMGTGRESEQLEIVRVPSQKSGVSGWSKVSARSVLKTDMQAQSRPSLEKGGFTRAPSQGSQASLSKSQDSHWSGIKSKLSAAASIGPEKASSWVFVGEFSEGKKHGLGIETHEDGKMYAGQWADGEMHGWGILTRKDGSVYRGQFEMGRMSGNGAEILMSSEQDIGFQENDPTRLFRSFEGSWINGRREGRGVAGHARSREASSIVGLVRQSVVKYSKGVLIPTDSVPLSQSKGQWDTLLQERMDAWAHAAFFRRQASEQGNLIQKVLIGRAASVAGKKAAALAMGKKTAGTVEVAGDGGAGNVADDENADVEDIGNELDESDPDLDLSEDEITKEMVQHWAQIKSMNDGSCEEQDGKDVRTAWDAYVVEQKEVEEAALALKKEREEAEQRARELERERLEALARLQKAQAEMNLAKTTQFEAMRKMKEAKALRVRAQQAKDEKKLIELQLVSLRDESVAASRALQMQADKELKAREQYDESQLHVKEAAAQLADCESRSEGAERNVRRLTQEYELGRDQLRVQAANSLTFHEVKEVFQKHDADGSGELDHVEIKLALEDLGLPCNSEAVDRFILQLDVDCTGTLDWQEFQQLARKTEQDTGEAGKLLKDASETEKEMKTEMNRAIATMMKCSANLSAAQLKVKTTHLSYVEREKDVEAESVKLVECKLTKERAEMSLHVAETKVASLGEQILSMEQSSRELSIDAAEAAANGSVAWETASRALMAAEQGEKEVSEQFESEAARNAARMEARMRAMAELEEADHGEQKSASGPGDETRTAWLNEYKTPLSAEEEEAKASGQNGGIAGFQRAASQIAGSFISRTNNIRSAATNSGLKQGRTIEMTVVKGVNLVSKDRGGTSDPFVEARLGEKKFKTNVCNKTLNPTWNETFTFEVARGELMPLLTLVVYDEDKGFFMGTSAEYMGSCDINLDQLVLGEESSAWHDLAFDEKYQKKREEITGKVQVRFLMKISNKTELNKGAPLQPGEQDKQNGVDFVYPDRRAKYCGEWKDGMRWGQGKLTLYSSVLPETSTVLFAGEQVPTENGGLCLGEKAFYDGLWQNDVPDGLGVMIDPMLGRYQGAWKRGVREGNGHFRDANGNTFQGRWKDDRRNGAGTEILAVSAILPNGEKYEGEWENSLRHGKGVTTRGDTYKHNGKWRRGKMHGKGTLEDDGINYVGDFKSGQRTGKGHIQYNDLLEYKGDMLNGKRQGNGIMLFEDDRRYNGEWDNDEMQGYGVMSYPNGDEYNGPFERGKRHGPKGSLEMHELDTGDAGSKACSARYIGDFYEDRMEGRGVIEWADGRKYEGQFQDGIRFGQGVMTFADGSVYDGNWIDGNRCGMGTLTLAEGGKYTGLFRDNLRHGRGTMERPNGEKFSGEWVQHQMHGKGTLTFLDGSTFDGEFVRGFMCGRGQYSHDNGKQYIGEWSQDKRHGHGEELDENGCKYSGLFCEDLRHGTGVWKAPSGHVYEGMWSKGLKHGWGHERAPADLYGQTWTEYQGEFKLGQDRSGKGKFVYANGDVYNGLWQNQLRHGHGRFVRSDGYVYEGEFVADKKNGIGKEQTTRGDTYQGEFHKDLRHGKGTEISANGNQYIGEFFQGTRSGEGKEFDCKTGSRYDGEFINDVKHGYGAMVHQRGALLEDVHTLQRVPSSDGDNAAWITYEGEWQENHKHGDGREISASDLTEETTHYFLGRKHQAGADHMIFRSPSLVLSETSKAERDTINEILHNLQMNISDEAGREEWIWRLEKGLHDDNPKCQLFRQQILEHGGVPVFCDLLKNDTDDMAQLKGGQFLFFMSRTVNFSALAATVMEKPSAVQHIVALLLEPTTEPRIYSCGILGALCKDKEFARLAVGAGAAAKLVALLRNVGWVTLKGKGLAALALKNIGQHQRAVVSGELGLPVATGGFGFDSVKNESERKNIDEAIRKILIQIGAGPAAMVLND